MKGLVLLIILVSGCSMESPTGYVVKEVECEVNVLSDSLVEEAIELGKIKDKNSILLDYLYPKYASDSVFVGVFTPYLKIALADKDLSQDEINKILKDDILFSVQLFGEREDFANNVKARISLENGSLVPSLFLPQKKANLVDNGFKAYNQYFFKDYEIFRNEVIEFILVYPDKEEEIVIDMRGLK
tara:strand:- start:54 stop:611 length:558 start_codon:yes stop_codon:yes gene_type:complete